MRHRVDYLTPGEAGSIGRMSGDDLHDELRGAIDDARRLQGELERFELAAAADQAAGAARSARRRRRALVAAGPVLLLAAAVTGWSLGLRPSTLLGSGPVAVQQDPGPSASGSGLAPSGGTGTVSPAEGGAAAAGGAADAATCVPLRVVAATAVVAPLRTVAEGLDAGPGCARVEVTAADGRTAGKAALAAGADVWVPDDPSWAAAAPEGLLPALTDDAPSGPVLATSPLLLATDPASSRRITAAGGGWAALDRLVGKEKRLRLVTAAPAGSGEGMLALGGLGEVVWLADGMDASAAALSALRGRTRTVPADRLRPDRPGEVAVLAEYRAAGLRPGLVLLTPKDRTVLLRFGWLVTRAGLADPARSVALQRFSQVLLGPQGRAAFTAAGLRGPDGAPPPGTAAALPEPLPVLEPHHVDHVFATWYPADRTVDLLVVVDVSRSMSRIPEGTDKALITLVGEGGRTVADLLPDRAGLGVWALGHRLDGDRDHQVLVAPGPLDPARRRAVDAAFGRLVTRPTGTGLYDTLLAAYTDALSRVRPGVPSQVLVFTDGRDEADPGSIGAAGLTRALAAAEAADPAAAASVSVGVMAFGDADGEALQRVLAPVNGYVDRIETPAAVADAFLHLAAGGLHG